MAAATERRKDKPEQGGRPGNTHSVYGESRICDDGKCIYDAPDFIWKEYVICIQQTDNFSNTFAECLIEG